MPDTHCVLIVGALFALSATAQTADTYVILGGGPLPSSSQVSIEQNVRWIDDVLQQRYVFSGSHILFGSGHQQAADVSLMETDNAEAQHWLPLARLYNQPQEALLTYRRNTVERNEGSASKDNVSALLKQTIASLKSGDNLFLVYSGHGSYDSSDVSNNALRLWGETRLDVNDFSNLLAATPGDATVRYVLPQCFSGAFARSIAMNPSTPTINTVARNRCGFFAVPENQIAEGCTAGIDAGDYRDYATYFVAALAGQTRTGTSLTTQPDLNSDGKVGLNEAHAYAYTEGFSTDIPRSTSDYYLELWEPWYARWHSFIALSANNPYWQLATRLAGKLNITATSPTILSYDALRERQRLNSEIAAADNIHANDQQTEEKLRHDLLQRFQRDWPNADHPQSAAYVHFLNEEAELALLWIQQQPEYAQLAALQDKLATSTLTSLQLKRQEAQYARLQRAMRLAAIKESFDRLASKEQRETYSALTVCEAWAPASKATANN